MLTCVRFAAAIRDDVDRTLSRADFGRVVMALYQMLKRGAEFRNGEVSFGPVPELDDIPCRQMVLEGGAKGTGVLSVYTHRASDNALLVLFVREGRGLCIAERNRIRAIFRQEVCGQEA